jgi:hypothetical protein
LLEADNDTRNRQSARLRDSRSAFALLARATPPLPWDGIGRHQLATSPYSSARSISSKTLTRSEVVNGALEKKRFLEYSSVGRRSIIAAVALHVAFYNLCRVHESLRSTPAMALGIADRVWTIGDLLDAALATQPITPTTTAPDRRKRFLGKRRRPILTDCG